MKTNGGLFKEFALGCELRALIVNTDLATCCVLLVLTILYLRYLKSRIKYLDERSFTPQDYTIMVVDPDSNADDPCEWKAFAERFGDVRCVTVARDNAQLVQELVSLWQLLAVAALSTSQSERERLAPHVAAAHLRVQTRSRRRANVCKVFITFEREDAQRLALTRLEVGKISARLDDTSVMFSSQDVFRGTNVLEVCLFSAAPRLAFSKFANARLPRPPQKKSPISECV